MACASGLGGPDFLGLLVQLSGPTLVQQFCDFPLFGGWASSALRPCGESLGSCAGGWFSLTGPTVLRGCWACFVLPARGKGVPSLSVGCVALCQVFHPSGRAAPGGLCTGLMPHFSQVVGRHALPPAHAHHSCVTCQKGTLILTSLLEDLA